MLLNPSQYLPSEELKYSNYPELYTVSEEMGVLEAYMEKANIAFSNYQEGIDDRIYLNATEMRNMRDLSFRITDVLGRAENVCYDVLLPIRAFQSTLNEFIFSFVAQPNEIVVDRRALKMTTAETEDEGVV